jgi:hypothetical protein
MRWKEDAQGRGKVAGKLKKKILYSNITLYHLAAKATLPLQFHQVPLVLK